MVRIFLLVMTQKLAILFWIIPRLHISIGAVIGAGVVVMKEVSPCAVVYGNLTMGIRYKNNFYVFIKTG